MFMRKKNNYFAFMLRAAIVRRIYCLCELVGAAALRRLEFMYFFS